MYIFIYKFLKEENVGMAEQVDATDLKFVGPTAVRVRFPLLILIIYAAIVKWLSRLTFYEESGVRIPVAVQYIAGWTGVGSSSVS